MNVEYQKEAAKTPAETVIGWLSIFLSFMVMACGYNNGEINTVFWVGVGFIPIGIILVLIGKQKHRANKGRCC